MTSVAIIGAGPYGLSVAAHLRSRGVRFRIFGSAMDSWRTHMPTGMMLKSEGFASNLSDPDRAATLSAYCADHGIEYRDTGLPVTLRVFNDYAGDFQRRFVPDLEECDVAAVTRDASGFQLELETGESLRSDFVVGAFGISHFHHVPAQLQHLPETVMTHSSAHGDLSAFAGRHVTVVGGGSSAVDTATLLSESGAAVSLIARRPLKFTPVSDPAGRGRWEQLRYPASGLGPSMRLWLYQQRPELFRHLPGQTRLRLIREVLGPQTPVTMKPRLEAGVTVSTGEDVEWAIEEAGRVRLVLRGADGETRDLRTDHVIAATGYYPRLDSVDFLSRPLRRAIRTHAEMPMVSSRFETSVPGLFLLGLAAVNSFGPLMRFVVGAEYAAPRLAAELHRRADRPDTFALDASPTERSVR